MFCCRAFCAGSDALLISAGVAGNSLFIADVAKRYSGLLFWFCCIWLAVYGALRLRWVAMAISCSQWSADGAWSNAGNYRHADLWQSACLLDTVVLIGAVSLQFEAMNKLYYGLGAAISNFVFFFSLVYGARFLAPYMEQPTAWRILDTGIAAIMFALAWSMLWAGGLL